MKITKNEDARAIIPELRGGIKAIRYPAFAEIKWDGEAALISYHKDREIDIISTNKYGTMRYDWSKLDDIKNILQDKDVKQAMFLGEIFYGFGQAGDLYKLLSNKDNDDLNIKIYDAVHIVTEQSEMIGTATSLLDRKEWLTELFFQSLFHTAPIVVNSKDEIDKVFDNAIKAGYEGIVVKNFDGRLVNGPCDWVKIKKKDQTAYQVAAIDQTKERIDIMAPSPNGHGVLVGVKVMNKVKNTLKIGDWVIIEHQGILDSGSLRHPVFIGKEEHDATN